MTPSHAYYHYTISRSHLVMTCVGPPRIELGPYLPLEPQMRPARLVVTFVGPLGIEPSLYEPESYVLPVYYGPTKVTTPNRMYYYQASRAANEL